MLAFSAGARYEWRKADLELEHSKNSRATHPEAVSSRRVGGKIENLVAKAKGTVAPVPVAPPIPSKKASNPAASDASPANHGQKAPVRPSLPLPVAPELGLRPGLASASDATSIPSIPSILSVQIPQTRADVPPVIRAAPDQRTEKATPDVRDSGVHVSLLSGKHEQPRLNLDVPSGVNVALLPSHSTSPAASAASPPLQAQSAPTAAWRVVTVLDHGVVIQRDGEPMQVISIGARLPDGSILTSVKPGVGQWESDRSSPKPTKPTKDVDHGSATSKSQ